MRTIRTNATVFDPPVRQVYGIFDSIDLNLSKCELLLKTMDAIAVVGENIRSQPKLSIVRSFLNTSSSVSNDIKGAIGPKVSSLNRRISVVMPEMTVASSNFHLSFLVEFLLPLIERLLFFWHH